MKDSGGTCLIMCPHVTSTVKISLHRLITTFVPFPHSFVILFPEWAIGSDHPYLSPRVCVAGF
jgi:hypothetical protein